MSKKNIETIPRFLYLNAYAFLLVLIGGGVAFIPVHRVSLWLIIPQAAIAIVCLKAAYTILSSWQDKKRQYRILMQRNKKELRPDTFSEYMQAPCSRLLTRMVLKDLGRSDCYKTLKKHVPLLTRIKQNCASETKVYTAEDYPETKD